MLGAVPADAAGDDLAALGEEVLERLLVLVVDLQGLVGAEPADLAAAEAAATAALLAVAAALAALLAVAAAAAAAEGLAPAAVAAAIGWPILRLTGDYLAICTLGFAEIVKVVFLNLEITNKALGLTVPTPNASFPMPLTVLIVVILVIIASAFIDNSRFGRALKAIRGDEIAAETCPGWSLNASSKTCGPARPLAFACCSASCAASPPCAACVPAPPPPPSR